MDRTGAPLKGPGTVLGIVDLEFAFNHHRAEEIYQNWLYTFADGLPRVTIAIRHTWLDFVFIFFYSFFLFFGSKSVSESFSGKISALGKLLAMASLYAGLFDIFENIGILAMLKGNTGGAIPLFTGIFSSMKWILVICSLMYIIVFGGYTIFRKKR